IPADWTRIDTDASRTGFPGFMDGPTGSVPEGYVKNTYRVPASFDFADLRAWMTGPTWADNPSGASFGVVRLEYCKPDSGTCKLHLAPEGTEPPEYFVTARLQEPSRFRDEPEVDVRLHYLEASPPDYDVSAET